jgi:hypothetical protein
MRILNDTITFDAADFAGLSDFALKAIASRIGTLDDFAIEAGVIFTRALDADKAALRQRVAESDSVKAVIEQAALTFDVARPGDEIIAPPGPAILE